MSLAVMLWAVLSVNSIVRVPPVATISNVARPPAAAKAGAVTFPSRRFGDHYARVK